MKNGQRSRIRIVEAQLRDLRAEEEHMRRENAEGEAMDRVSRSGWRQPPCWLQLISQSSNT